MFDIGWMELLVIGVVALIVIGPKDLPEMFRQLGRFTGKLRGMAREFQRAMDQAAKESGVGDVAKDLKTMTSPKNLGLDAVKSAADRFEKWDPMKNAAKPSNPAMVGAKPLEVKLPPNPAPAAAAVVETVAEVAPAPAAKPFAAAAKAAPGSATAALAEKQAAKRAVLAETAEKLRAIEAGTAAPEKPKRARKPAAAASAAAAKPPRAPRKTKAPDA